MPQVTQYTTPPPHAMSHFFRCRLLRHERNYYLLKEHNDTFSKTCRRHLLNATIIGTASRLAGEWSRMAFKTDLGGCELPCHLRYMVQSGFACVNNRQKLLSLFCQRSAITSKMYRYCTWSVLCVRACVCVNSSHVQSTALAAVALHKRGLICPPRARLNDCRRCSLCVAESCDPVQTSTSLSSTGWGRERSSNSTAAKWRGVPSGGGRWSFRCAIWCQHTAYRVGVSAAVLL